MSDSSYNDPGDTTIADSSKKVVNLNKTILDYFYEDGILNIYLPNSDKELKEMMESYNSLIIPRGKLRKSTNEFRDKRIRKLYKILNKIFNEGK